MKLKQTSTQLSNLLSGSLPDKTFNWLEEKIELVTREKSTKELFLTYSLLSSKIDKTQEVVYTTSTDLVKYLQNHDANYLEISRLYLLVKILEINPDFFTPKVANIIQVADKTELATFLRYLAVLPNARDFKHTAVDALRTNIASVFNAIALNNPYPGLYFSDKQWNQMYLKTAFMQGDLSQIEDVDDRANADLARIISDYAHERWAAGREIEPYFWRPVSNFIEGQLFKDMQRLLESENKIENKAAALCCYYSDKKEAKELIQNHPNLISQIENKNLNWQNLKDQ